MEMEIIRRSRCIVCENTKRPLHKFPKDQDQLQQWLSSLTVRVSQLYTETEEYFLNNARICVDHFDEKDFTSNLKHRLRKGRIPKSQLRSPSPPRPAVSNSSNEEMIIANEHSTESIKEKRKKSTITSQSNSPAKKKLITHLKVEISKMKKKLKRSSLTELLNDHLSGTQHQFVLSQVKNSLRNGKKPRWTKEDKCFALKIFNQSPSAYKLLRKNLSLPSISTLRRPKSYCSDEDIESSSSPIPHRAYEKIISKRNNIWSKEEVEKNTLEDNGNEDEDIEHLYPIQSMDILYDDESTDEDSMLNPADLVETQMPDESPECKRVMVDADDDTGEIFNENCSSNQELQNETYIEDFIYSKEDGSNYNIQEAKEDGKAGTPLGQFTTRPTPVYPNRNYSKTTSTSPPKYRVIQPKGSVPSSLVIHPVCHANVKKIGGHSCSIDICRNTSFSTKKKGLTVRYFSFPKDHITRQKWILKCHRKRKVNPNTARVCSVHFTAEDYEDGLKAKLMGETPIKLKRKAVPSLLISPPSPHPEHLATEGQEK